VTPMGETATNIYAVKKMEMPSLTYRANWDKEEIYGAVDGIEAMKQAIYKILFTERYRYVIYDWNYGIELEDLMGRSISYVIPEVKKRIVDALLADRRIDSVYDFAFRYTKTTLLVTFTAKTTMGEIFLEKVVRI